MARSQSAEQTGHQAVFDYSRRFWSLPIFFLERSRSIRFFVILQYKNSSPDNKHRILSKPYSSQDKKTHICLRLPVSLSGKTRKTLRLCLFPKIHNLRRVWQNIHIVSINSFLKSCVSFDDQPASDSRNLPREDHWQPVKQGSEIDEYFWLFSLKSRELWVFWHDGEEISGRGGVLFI